MKINQFEVWVADLSPRIGTETGKKRPVLVIQTDLMNSIPHPSTIICPITTNVKNNAKILRVHLKSGEANVNSDCDIMIDQMRSIDNKRLVRKIGNIPSELESTIKDNLRVVLDL